MRGPSEGLRGVSSKKFKMAIDCEDFVPRDIAYTRFAPFSTGKTIWPVSGQSEKVDFW